LRKWGPDFAATTEGDVEYDQAKAVVAGAILRLGKGNP
jgi:hypothetical protein